MTRNQHKRVLHDAGNKKVANGDNASKSDPIILEEQWRELVLEYYITPDQSVSRFLEEKKTTQRNQFDKRWVDSGLKQLKSSNDGSCDDAIAQYDHWIKTAFNIKRILSEGEWRTYILTFYRSDNQSMSKFLKTSNITQRSKFKKRWIDSGLKESKLDNVEYDDAVHQYDLWFTKWKRQLNEKNRTNANKLHKKFEIYIDNETDDISNNKKNDDDNNSNADGVDANVDQNGSGRNNEDKSNGNDSCNNDDEPQPTLTQDESDGDNDGYRRQPRTKRLSGDDMKRFLIDFYVDKTSSKILPFMQEKDVINSKGAIYRHWENSGMKRMKEQSEPLVSAVASYDEWVLHQNVINAANARKNGSTEKVFPEDLEIFMRHLIKQMALCGQGFGKKAAGEILTNALKNWSRPDESAFSRSTLDRFINNYQLECKSVKNIDPARIAQVTPENRDSFFFRLDQIVSLVHDMDPINCPWKNWKDVDSRNIDNMDEMGSDSTRFRDVMLIPKEVRQRLFQSTPEGDRAKMHITLAVFSKSNGYYKNDSAGIDGAPMPMVIHTKQTSSSKQKGVSAIEKRILLYKQDDFINVDPNYSEGFDPENPLGITVRTSSSGSMTKDLFLDAMLHYVKHLAADQGPNGKFVFLLLDSHVSRWNPKALYTLFKNRVIAIYFPSHLSIVVQPQDNGVILYLHKCIERASQLNRLFKSETDIENTNRVLEKAFHLFRDGERKKLIDHGSNSTTRSYRIPGIKPRDPFLFGWRDNLELYGSFNRLRMHNGECPNYGVRPKNVSVRREFSEAEIDLLNEAIPILAKDDDTVTILDDPRTKCYAIANNIVNEWVAKASDQRPVRPRSTNAVETLSLEYMEITHIVSCEPDSDSVYLESNRQEAKKHAILNLTSSMETIQAKPKGIDQAVGWCKATKMAQRKHLWSVFNGESTKEVTTQELHDNWVIDLEYDLFPQDKELRDKRWRSELRKKNEKNLIIERMAKVIAEEERDAELKEVYEQYLAQPNKSFAAFKESVLPIIEHPSSHSVTVNFGSEEHAVNVYAHGNNTSSMLQMVIDNVCGTLIGALTKSERKAKRRRGGKVNRTRRGSDGIVKVAQIDEQHQLDLLLRGECEQRTRMSKIDLCKRRLSVVRQFATMPKYLEIWKDDGSLLLNSKQLTKPQLAKLLKIFNVQGRTKIASGSKESIRNELRSIKITQHKIEEMEISLVTELENFGETDGFQLDQSFGDNSFGGDVSSVVLETETSVGDIDIESDDTDTLVQKLGDMQRTKSVSFDDSPTIRTIPAVDNDSSSSSTVAPAPKKQSSRRKKQLQQSEEPPPSATGSEPRKAVPSLIPTARRNPSRRNPTRRKEGHVQYR